MASAYKCDICGKLYSKDDHQQSFYGLYLFSISSENYADLCEECSTKFEKFIETERFKGALEA